MRFYFPQDNQLENFVFIVVLGIAYKENFRINIQM